MLVNWRLEELILEGFMSPKCSIHHTCEGFIAPKRIEEWIVHKIRIGEKSVFNTPGPNAKCRGFFAQHCICVRDLIYCLGVNRIRVPSFAFQDTQNCDTFCLLILNGKAESPSNLRLEYGSSEFECMVEVLLGLISIPFVVLAETAIKDHEWHVVTFGRFSRKGCGSPGRSDMCRTRTNDCPLRLMAAGGRGFGEAAATLVGSRTPHGDSGFCVPGIVVSGERRYELRAMQGTGSAPVMSRLSMPLAT
jgi:hypothetical protein